MFIICHLDHGSAWSNSVNLHFILPMFILSIDHHQLLQQSMVDPDSNPIPDEITRDQRPSLQILPWKHHRDLPDEISIYRDPHGAVPPYFSKTIASWKNYLQWYGSRAQLVVTEPELIKEVLTSRNGDYEKEAFSAFMRDLIGDGLVVSRGEKWVKMRRLANHAFHGESLKGMVPAVIASVEMMLERWKNLNPEGGRKEIEAYQEFRLLTSEIISRTAFGSSYMEGEKVFELLKKMVLLISRNQFKVRIPGLSTFLRIVFRTGDEHESAVLQQDIKSTIMNMVAKREQENQQKQDNNSTSTSSATDFLGLLLKAYTDTDTKNSITLDDMVDECKTFYVAGHETTTSSLTWTVFLLAVHSEWQEKAREQVVQLFGKDKSPTPDGISRLSILTMIINESLRLYPPFFHVSRKVERHQVRLGSGGLQIPKGTEVYIPFLAVHHGTETWGEDAQLFRPERFTEGISKASTNFLPFGLGPRTCVGMNFAITQEKIAIAMILQRYRFTLSDKYVHSPTQVLNSCPRLRRRVYSSLAEKLYTHLQSNPKNVERALNLTKPKLDAASVNEVLQRCSSLNDSQLGLRFFVWAGCQSSYRHSSYMYDSVSQLFRLRENPRVVLDLIEAYKAEEFSVTVKTFKIVLNLCRELKLADEALSVLRNMPAFDIRADTSAYNVVIRLLCEKGDLDMADKLMGEMGLIDLYPDMITFVTMIKGFCHAGRVAEASGLLKTMRKTGCTPNVVVYSTLLDGVTKYGSVEEALELLSEMEKQGGDCSPNVVTYTSLIQVLCEKGKVVDAVSIFDKMEGSGVSPNRVTVSTLIKGLCEDGLLEEAYKLIDRVVVGGWVSSGECYSSLVLCLLRMKNSEEAEIVFRSLLTSGTKPDSLACSLMIRDLSSKTRVLDAFHLYEEIEKMSGAVTLDSDIYSILLLGLCQQGHLVEAAKTARSIIGKNVRLQSPYADKIVEHIKKFEDKELIGELTCRFR
ncbi:Cytochrome P450 CYP749A22 [Linum perenne]